ncbi:MAG: hypothetical protein ACK6DP_19705 [Gemmatimonas sp.]|jgi:hypothetical protein|uniref:hypothetical protein n=1 Tax=Gemmatimonas sp. TaxID=1962908 RepID=UPI00391F7E13|nr:hypothetical protein [Gemmatimonadota bacterium]
MHDQTQGAPGERHDAKDGQTMATAAGYPLGRGYGHDIMRGGEVFGGYGYSDRPDYERTRGEQRNKG